MELSYPNVLPANTTSYVKIQTQDNLLPSLLGGSLGTVVSNVLGAVLVGNQEFTVQAKMEIMLYFKVIVKTPMILQQKECES